MQRITGTTVATDLFGSGKHGFQEGDPVAQVPATVVSAQFLNHVQEELARAIEQSGQTLDPSNLGQLAEAIARAAASGPEVPDFDIAGALAAFVTQAHSWTAAQRLTSGYMANHFGVSGEVLYANADTGAPTPKERTIRVPLSAFQAEYEPAGGVRGWHIQVAQSGYPRTGLVKHPDFDTGLYAEVSLPTGASLVRVVARVQGIPWNNNDSSVNLSTGLADIEEDFVFFRTVEKNTGPLNGTTLLQVDAAVELPWLGPLHADSQTLLVRFTAAGSIAVNWVQVTFRDPGPRNF
jgi:hypothetical protein